MEQYKNHPNAMPTPAQACSEATRLTYTSPTITSVEFAVEVGSVDSQTSENRTNGLFRVRLWGELSQQGTSDPDDLQWSTKEQNEWF